MSLSCPAIVEAGMISGVLETLDCQTRAFAQGGYEALTRGSGVFSTALLALLTIYVALIGWRLLFAPGGLRLSDTPGMALKIGAILALVGSWSTFQTLVFDVASRAPLEIAAVASAPWTSEAGHELAANPVAGLERTYTELTQTAAAFAKIAGPNVKAYASPEAGAAESLATASAALFIISAGVIGGATLAIGVLTATGPLFVALMLLGVTRGIFVGWVRALVGAALTLLVAWLLLVLLLVVIGPWLETLAQQRAAQQLRPETALSTAALVLVFACGQAGLVLAAWAAAIAFRLPAPRIRTENAGGRQAPAARDLDIAAAMAPTRSERLALDLQREQSRTELRLRTASTAATASGFTARGELAPTAAAPARLGEAYRRPAGPYRRSGAAR